MSGHPTGGYDRGECLNSFETYDIATNRWSKLPSMLAKRGRFDVAAVGDSCLYAVAGSNGQIEENSVEKFDSAAGKWRPVASLPVRLSNIGETHRVLTAAGVVTIELWSELPSLSRKT